MEWDLCVSKKNNILKIGKKFFVSKIKFIKSNLFMFYLIFKFDWFKIRHTRAQVSFSYNNSNCKFSSHSWTIKSQNFFYFKN